MTFWVAGAAIGGAVLSGAATKSAAKTQANATRAGIDAQQAQFDQTREDQAPYRAAGSAALGQLGDLLGVPGAQGFDSAAYLRAYPDVAADPYYSQHAEEHYNTLGKNEGRTLPTTAPSAEFGSYAKPLTADQVQMDPGYQFGLKQGQQAIDRKTAAAGGRISGASLKAAAQYGTDYATSGYSTAYNRQNQARSDRLNRLAALAGIGQTSVQQTGAAGTNSANQISALTSAQGNATGAAQIAQGKIWGDTGNQLAALYGRNVGTPGTAVNMGTATGNDLSTFY